MKFKFDAEESLGLLFWQSSTLWKRCINKALAEFKITHTQYVILAIVFYLENSGEKSIQKNISDISMIDAMTISKTVRLMQKNNLIERIEDSKDSRAKVLRLTSEGKKLLNIVNSVVEEIDMKFFSLTNEEINYFIKIMKKLKNYNIDNLG